MTLKFFNYLNPLYMNDVFKLADQSTIATRTSLFKLSQPLRKPITDKKLLHMWHLVFIWNKLPSFLKTTDNVNTSKHRAKKDFFQRMNNDENNI